MEYDPVASQEYKRQSFFACYLLCSLSPRYKGCTYIGFTINPRRRIRQHNGEITSGAWRTKKKRPWEMILCIYGFPSQVSALQFEWAWQNPKTSLAVKEAAEGLKQLGGIMGQIRLAYTMLTLPEWKRLNLTVNFLSTKHTSNIKGLPTLPYHMKVQICPVDELPCYRDSWLPDEEDDLEEHLFNKSDDSDLEEEAQGVKNPVHQKESSETKMQQEQENYEQPAKKCRRRGHPLKQKFSNNPADELASKTAIPSSRKASSSMVLADARSMGQGNLNNLRVKHDDLFEISDSEISDDVYNSREQSSKFGMLDSFLVSNTSTAVSLKGDVSCAMENNWSINFKTDSCLLNDREARKSRDISYESTIKNRLSAASDPVETKLSDEDGKCDYIVAKGSEVDMITENMDDFSIESKMTRSSYPIEFPTLQEYSPVCYISPLKTSEDALFPFISPCKPMSTNKLTKVNLSFLSPVASKCPVITISSTPRPVSRHVIDLTDSPAS